MAVYTALEHEDICAFLEHYDAGALLSFKGIAEGVENTNYLLITEQGGRQVRYILTIYEQRVRAEDLPFFLKLTEWLADRGIACPRPVRGQDGETVRGIKGKPAALICFLEGHGLGSSAAITPAHLALTGGVMAMLHLAAQDFPLRRVNTLSLTGWRQLFGNFSARADAITPGLKAEMAQELEYLEAHWPDDLPAGIIHADVFPDNVLFTSGADGSSVLSGIIDFYFACRDYWMYDIAICLNAWCFSSAHQFLPERARALLEGYEAVRALTAEERTAMPILARGAAMRFLVTRAHDWLNRVDGALVTVKDPMEYLHKLRFHQRIDNYAAYGLA